MSEATDLRDLARRLYDAAVAAADPARALTRAMATDPPRSVTGRTFLVAFGKAAPAMARAALDRLGGADAALVVTHHGNGADVPGARVLTAGHPEPDADGVAAAEEVLTLLDEAGPGDRVIALVSGGGSALLPAPAPPLTLANKRDATRALLAGGLAIEEVNLVRQHLSELKGGGMARRAAPAEVTAYILSDVIGDDLRAVASGPTAGPLGTADEARALLTRAGLWSALPAPARRRLEAAAAPGPVPKARNVLIGSNRMSLEAMEAEATTQRVPARIVDAALVGDVARAAKRIVERFEQTDHPIALLFGGETTVRLAGHGTGGRNQELALRVALTAPETGAAWVFLSGGTDGRDGPTDAAGAIVDAGTPVRIRAAGGDARALLADNDSYAALELSGDLLRVAPTGTNVADVQALILAPPADG
ncbi:Putative hydroxypyruvate reductase [Roseivivax jejudonensis]|uniref:Putative hydroxypyruvate reductase n=1 Tax=Roseivivax jejudonensis TaxID=1529041 RepID=A0A1X6ZHZ7_9RHOB|nr:DUF4147 domain-containing protein [Roseivivax jejudonensis]SLN51696.1 Putative hydroxypyruvate reductase [Roseivivax jejudonensis]